MGFTPREGSIPSSGTSHIKDLPPGCRLPLMSALITPTQEKALITVAAVCFALMFLVLLRLQYVIGR